MKPVNGNQGWPQTQTWQDLWNLCYPWHAWLISNRLVPLSSTLFTSDLILKRVLHQFPFFLCWKCFDLTWDPANKAGFRTILKTQFLWERKCLRKYRSLQNSLHLRFLKSFKFVYNMLVYNLMPLWLCSHAFFQLNQSFFTLQLSLFFFIYPVSQRSLIFLSADQAKFHKVCLYYQSTANKLQISHQNPTFLSFLSRNAKPSYLSMIQIFRHR